MSEELTNLEPLNLSMGRFSIASLTYYNDFKECTILVFDSETGDIKQRGFTLDTTKK